MNVQKEMISYKTNVQLQINLHLSMWSKKNLGGWCDIIKAVSQNFVIFWKREKSNSRKLKKKFQTPSENQTHKPSEF